MEKRTDSDDEQAASPIENVATNVSYKAAVSACGKGHQAHQETQLLQEMSCGKIMPNELSDYAAVSACEKGHQAQQVAQLYCWLVLSALLPQS